MTAVRPATATSFDEVWPLLERFESAHLGRDDWRRMLFDLPWPAGEAQRGLVLYDDAGRAVGFLGTILSRRTIAGRVHRFCNLSSWIVLPEHRAAAMQLVLPVLAMRDTTIVNLTASAAAHEIFRGLGFRPLETTQHLVPWVPRAGEMARWPDTRVLTEPADMRAALDEPGRRILDDHLGTRATQVVLEDRGRTCHVVAIRSPWKGSWRLAHVLYASDWALLVGRPAHVIAALYARSGAVGLRIEARHVTGAGRLPRFTRTRPLEWPTLYRPASPDVTPGSVDGLYTELVGQAW